MSGLPLSGQTITMYIPLGKSCLRIEKYHYVLYTYIKSDVQSVYRYILCKVICVYKQIKNGTCLIVERAQVVCITVAVHFMQSLYSPDFYVLACTMHGFQ